MKRAITFGVCLLAFAIAAVAQSERTFAVPEFQRIQFDAVGRVEFTQGQLQPVRVTGPERDLRQIEVKVVKTLRLESPGDRKLRNGFLQEAKNHDSNTTLANGRNTVIFSEETRQSDRVYMLKYNDDYAEATIIVNFKKSQK